MGCTGDYIPWSGYALSSSCHLVTLTDPKHGLDMWGGVLPALRTTEAHASQVDVVHAYAHALPARIGDVDGN